MIKITDAEKQKQIEQNMIFVGTIYDTFEALEETLGRLKMEQPLFMVYAAKKAFAAEVFKYADREEISHKTPRQICLKSADKTSALSCLLH
jgi:hypothetical protein